MRHRHVVMHGVQSHILKPRPIAPLIIDLEKGGLVPNPQYKESNNTKL